MVKSCLLVMIVLVGSDIMVRGITLYTEWCGISALISAGISVVPLCYGAYSL